MIKGKTKIEKNTGLEKEGTKAEKVSLLPPLSGLYWDYWKRSVDGTPAFVEGWIKDGKLRAYCHKCGSNGCIHVYLHLLEILHSYSMKIAERKVGITLDDVFDGKVPKGAYSKVREYAEKVGKDQIEEYLLKEGINPEDFRKYLSMVRDHNFEFIRKLKDNGLLFRNDPFME